ncbi:MAG: putative glycoside hydrolase [Candidatus Hydrogenedentes bacterium]|nr:putative glycoside hydrolase [Candidatus Hydrogenedentota bacterium]
MLLFAGIALSALAEDTVPLPKTIPDPWGMLVLPAPWLLPEPGSVTDIPGNPFPCLPKKASPIAVRALYLTGWTVGIPSQLKHYAELADKTVLTAYVVDIKDMDGHVGYKSAVPKVVEYGAFEKRYDPLTVIETFHAHNLRVIGRVACFRDPVASAKEPDMALKTKNGKLWTDVKKSSWLNPYNEKAWEYLVDIAKEALTLGFDEIQFDYVRFPSDGPVHTIDYGKDPGPKHEAVNGFLSYAREQMPDVVISADVFGIMCVSAGDTEDIGQYLELVAQNVDYLSPMVYPSHYAKGQVIQSKKYASPDKSPYAVVKGTLDTAQERIKAVRWCETARMRPYLQDFTASWLGSGHYMNYGVDEVRAQIKAAKDAGYAEWIFWNAQNRYTEAAYLPEKAKPGEKTAEIDTSSASRETE